MSVLLFGVSNRSAPVSVLEQLSVSGSDQAKIAGQVLQSSLVTEAMVLSTCNRVEVYAVVEAFHGGIMAIGQVLSERSGMSLRDLTKYAYVRYAEAAAEHLFAVACGLDSAVLGEQQVLGQVRRAYVAAEANHTIGHVLHDVVQRALAVGKRVHSETGIDAAGASTVSVAVGMADAQLGGLAGRSAVIVGAGSMGALSAKHLACAGVQRIHVVSRSLPHAHRLADKLCAFGVDADARRLKHISTALADADVVVSCTSALRPVVTLPDVHRGLADRPRRRTLVICDLGMPRDVELAVTSLPDVCVIDMDRVQREPSAHASAADTEAARQIVAAEVDGYVTGQQMAAVTPTVAALRQHAADVMEAELLCLERRLPGLDSVQREQVARAVRRVVEKLLHTPTVRVKQLASTPGGDSYADALRELFELDPQAVDAVARASRG